MTNRAFDKIAGGLNEALQVASAVPRLTPAQRKALLWLPEDGSSVWWIGRYGTGPIIRTPLRALVKMGLANEDWPDQNPSRFALTPAGIAARKELEEGK